MASLISLCNQSLAEIYKGQIGDIDEASLEARECNRFAPSLLEEMIEWSDCFPWARKRAELAGVVNDRPAEWLHAYGAPSNMSTPLLIREKQDDATYLPIRGPSVFPYQSEEVLPFVHEESRIYTNVPDAILVFTVNQIEVSDLPALGRRAFVLELAARLATPLTKDTRLATSKREEAELARARFVADEENKAPRRNQAYVSEAEWARLGYEI